MKKTVGDLLREARSKKGLALQTIERSTGVATHDLLAIELDQFSLIEPEKFDHYLRVYAEAVELDFEELRRACDLQASGSLEEPKMTTSFDDLVAETNPDYVPGTLSSRHGRRYSRSERANYSSPKKTQKKSSVFGMIFGLLMGLLVLAGLAFAGFKVYEKFFASKPETTASSTASSTSASSSTTPSSSEEVTGAQLAVTGGGEILEVVVTNVQQVPLVVEIAYAGQASSWVALTNSDLGEAGTTLSPEQPSYTATMLEGAAEGLLTLGVTEGVTVKIDGKELDLSALTTAASSFITIKIQ